MELFVLPTCVQFPLALQPVMNVGASVKLFWVLSSIVSLAVQSNTWHTWQLLGDRLLPPKVFCSPRVCHPNYIRCWQRIRSVWWGQGWCGRPTRRRAFFFFFHGWLPLIHGWPESKPHLKTLLLIFWSWPVYCCSFRALFKYQGRQIKHLKQQLEKMLFHLKVQYVKFGHLSICKTKRVTSD